MSEIKLPASIDDLTAKELYLLCLYRYNKDVHLFLDKMFDLGIEIRSNGDEEE